MIATESPAAPPVLAPEEGPVADVVNARGRMPLVLVCEHASRFIPARLSELGLTPEAAASHAAWDIGALALAKALGAELDAPLVVSRVSRLVYDCNRAPGAPDAIPARSEVHDVPGNHGLSRADRAQRQAEIYAPFHETLRDVLDGRTGPSALVTVHSFTPVYNGAARVTELGLLHDSDDRLARAMLAAAPGLTGLRTALNQPYSARDGVMHTLAEHALPRGVANVMLELRNDLLATPDAIAMLSGELAALIRAGLADVGQARDARPRGACR